MDTNAAKRLRGADLLKTAAILGVASGVCFFLRDRSGSDSLVPLIFVFAVLCVSRLTHGYGYGIAAAILAVFGVNYAFTYPFFQLNFTLTGYPLTFLIMLAVAISVSTLTTQIKAQELIRLEVERERMRSNLLRAISHDIRTPLTSIAGSASAILDNSAVLNDEEKLTLTRNIRNEAEWLNQIVENLLSVTRFSSEGAALHKSPELAEEIAESAVQKFQGRHPELSVHILVPEEVLLIPVDPVLIEQVLVNYLENAAIHGKRTSRIEVQVRREGETAVFTVTDDGIGIRKELLPRLFDGTLPAGNMGGSGRNMGDSGRNMGIGLSVCRAIITAHGGTVSARNLPEGKGAAFSFTLPLEEEAWKSETES